MKPLLSSYLSLACIIAMLAFGSSASSQNARVSGGNVIKGKVVVSGASLPKVCDGGTVNPADR
jgi:hypothetical protein